MLSCKWRATLGSCRFFLSHQGINHLQKIMQFKSENTSLDAVVEFCGPLISEVLGDGQITLSHFESIKAAQSQSLIFVNTEKYLEEAEASAAAAVVAPQKLREQVVSLQSQKTWLLSPNPELAALKIKKQFVFATPYRSDLNGIHATAVIDPSAELGIGVVVGPFAVIGPHCKIGEGTFIGAHSVIEEKVIIKSHCTIHPQVYIGHSCEVGANCEIMPFATIGTEGFGYAHDHKGNHYRIPHTGRVILHDDVHVGSQSAIDRGTLEDSVIGQGTKIDNQVHLAHNTVIGKNGLVTAHVVIAGSTTIGDNFVVGGNSAITGHIKITDNVHLAGFTGVANDIKTPGQYGGYPPLPIKDALRVRASLSHMPALRKQVNRILRKLFPEDFQ